MKNFSRGGDGASFIGALVVFLLLAGAAGVCFKMNGLAPQQKMPSHSSSVMASPKRIPRSKTGTPVVTATPWARNQPPPRVEATPWSYPDQGEIPAYRERGKRFSERQSVDDPP